MAIPDRVIGSGLPIPGVYKQRQQQAEAAYQQALIDLQGKERDTSQNYGFTSEVDPTTGAATNIHIDPSQQFSQVFDLLRGHASNLQNLRQQLTGQHLGRQGLAAKRTNLLRFMQQGQVAGLGSQYGRAMGNLFNQRGAALRGRDSEFNQAESDAVAYAIANGLFNTAAPAGPAPGIGSDAGGAGTNAQNSTTTTTGPGQTTTTTAGDNTSYTANTAQNGLADTLAQVAMANAAATGSPFVGGPAQGRFNPDEVGMGPGSLALPTMIAQSLAANPQASSYPDIQIPPTAQTRRNRAFTEGY